MRRLWVRKGHGATAVGYIEHVNHGVVRGWAFDPGRPKANLVFYVFVKDVYAGCGKTGIFRPDLAVAGYGDGTHAFTFHLPSEIAQKNANFDDIEIYTESIVPTRLGQVRKDGNLEPRPADEAKLTAKGFFDGLVTHMISSKTPPSAQTMVGRRRQIDKILEPVAIMKNSAFIWHIAAKYGRSAADSSFWNWYLDNYLMEKGNARPVLSDTDIESIGNFQHKELCSRSSSSRLNMKYNWAIEDSRRFYIEDCAVSRIDREYLRQIPILSRAQKFPLSQFMVILRKRQGIINRYGMSKVDERIKIYTLIMLSALRDVHFLSYMPFYWLQKMLEGKNGFVPFEAAQKSLLVRQDAISSALFRTHVKSLGFDLDAQEFDDKIEDKHRVKFGNRILGGEVEVDIQCFGPFEHNLGLSHSAARLVDALCFLGHSPNCVNVDIGMSQKGWASSLPLARSKRSNINIIHLNAEEIPELIAFSPDCFSASYNVIFPYWELGRPSRAHLLGISLVDEIWTATEFLAHTFAPSGKPVSCVGMSSKPEGSITREMGRRLMRSLGVRTDRFVFLATSDALSWSQRKNVLGGIEAFCAAFPAGEATLVVKTRNLDGPLDARQRDHWRAIRHMCQSNASITFLDAEISDDQQRALLAGCDCLLSLHRAEGLGLDMLDALGRGIPVVATAYSGNIDFCKSDTAWLVDFELVRVDPRDYCFVEPEHVWAHPKPESAVAAIRGVFFDRKERERRAEQGLRLVESRWSRESFARRLDQAIRSIRRRLGSEEL